VVFAAVTRQLEGKSAVNREFCALKTFHKKHGSAAKTRGGGGGGSVQGILPDDMHPFLSSQSVLKI